MLGRAKKVSDIIVELGAEISDLNAQIDAVKGKSELMPRCRRHARRSKKYSARKSTRGQRATKKRFGSSFDRRSQKKTGAAPFMTA
jgi:hypothetical protein